MIEEEPGLSVSVSAFPTGYAFINIIQGMPFSISGNISGNLESRCYIAGQGYSPFNLQMQQVQRAVTIQLQPYALPLLLNIPAKACFDWQIDLYDINSALAEKLEAALHQEESGTGTLAQIDHILTDCSTKAAVDPRVDYALRYILKKCGNLTIKELYEVLNLSERRGQQLFKYYLGMPAKSFCQVIKMQSHSFELLMGKKLDSVVPDGYYDQSHFIHELKRQTGMLPGEYEQCITAPDKKMAYISSNLFFNT